MSKIFNPAACRVLFTMHSFSSSLPSSNYFQPPNHIQAQMSQIDKFFDINYIPPQQSHVDLTAYQVMNDSKGFSNNVMNQREQ